MKTEEKPMQSTSSQHTVSNKKKAVQAGAAQDTVQQGVSQAESVASSVAQSAKNTAQESVSTARQKVDEMAMEKKDQARSVAKTISKAIHASAKSLEEDDMKMVASYVHKAADQIDHLADGIEDHNIRKTTGSVESFIAQRPYVTLGLFALAGFTLSSLLKRS
jgi:ElaB/YqjD/DUF883 family membrane-anchored ribosome-binding protein